MRWARDVIAPLLVACAAPKDVLCFSAGKQHLSSAAFSIGTKWRLRRLARNRQRSRTSVSSAAEPAASRLRCCRSCYELQLGHDELGAPTSGVVMATSSIEGDIASAATRYTIEVDVHPDVRSVAVKHASQLPRFLDNYPISAHTRAAYAHAVDFVRDFHFSHHRPAGNDGTAMIQQQRHHEERDKKGGAGASRIPQRQQQQQQPLPVVLDSGCGTGRSSALLARSYPRLPVIGIDRSAVRLSKGGATTGKGGVGRGRHRGVSRQQSDVDQGCDEKQDDGGDANEDSSPPDRGEGKRDHGGGRRDPLPGNLLLLRADLVDLWILASSDNAWDVKEHFILYPNPYPKRSQLRARWHGHSVFPVLLGLGGNITLRSNWEAYLDEVCCAVLAINDEAEKSHKQGGMTLADEGVFNREEVGGEGTGNQHDDSAGRDITDANTVAAATLLEAATQEVGGGDRNSDVHETGDIAGQPAIDIPTAVAAAAASYAYSARVGPSLFVPTLPAATNFEAKYVAVGETVFELRLEPRRQQ